DVEDALLYPGPGMAWSLGDKSYRSLRAADWPGFHARPWRKFRQAERGPGARGAGDRRQQFRAPGRAIGGRSRNHRPTAVLQLRGDEEVNPSLEFKSFGRITGERQNIQSLAGGKGIASQFRDGLAPTPVGALQRQQLVDRGLHRCAAILEA